MDDIKKNLRHVDKHEKKKELAEKEIPKEKQKTVQNE